MLLFKIFGFLATICATYSFGFLKSNELKQRSKKLHSFKKSVITLKEKIRTNSGEIENLLIGSFNEFPPDYRYLEKEDTDILEDFFKDIGMSDTTTEYKRCELYISLLSQKAEDADRNFQELSKLYRSIGLFSGIFIFIILL